MRNEVMTTVCALITVDDPRQGRVSWGAVSGHFSPGVMFFFFNQAKHRRVIWVLDLAPVLASQGSVGLVPAFRDDPSSPSFASGEIGQHNVIQASQAGGQDQAPRTLRHRMGNHRFEEAAAAGLVIKKAHPVVQVSVYDTVNWINKIIELPEGSGAGS